MSLFTETFKVADGIPNDRTPSDVLKYMMTEVGELSEEVIIAEGKSYKDPGKDGIVGEAIDVAVCAFDIIHRMCPDMTEGELMKIAQPKLDKWAEKAWED